MDKNTIMGTGRTSCITVSAVTKAELETKVARFQREGWIPEGDPVETSEIGNPDKWMQCMTGFYILHPGKP